MSMHKIGILFVLIFLCPIFTSAKDVIIASGHNDYPPIMWQNKKTINGVGALLVTEIMRRLDQDIEIKYVGPWKRVQEYARDGKIDLIIGCYSNNERRSYMDYTVPYMLDPTTIFVKKNNAFSFKVKEDLIGKHGSTMHGDSFGEDMDQFILNKLNITRVYTAEANFKNLLSGNVDYVLWGFYPCMINARRFGYEDDIKAIKPDLSFENMYMAFSKKSKYRNLIPKINKIINQIKKQGMIEKWVDISMEEYANQYMNDVQE